MKGLAVEATNQWSIRINVPALSMELRRGNEVWRRFTIAVGKAVTPTPIGSFTIVNMIKNPTWYPVGRPPVPPGAKNPLGGYWLGLSLPGYGIHGNNQSSSIGYPQSNGCIRMHNHDLQVLIRFVHVGTPVEINYETVEVKNSLNKVWLTIYSDLYRRQSTLQGVIRRKVEEQPPLYPIHWEALWEIIGEERPVVIEMPQKLPLLLDGALYQTAAFQWEERIYLPSELTKLWGRNCPERFLELTEFMRLFAGQIYGVYDQQAKKISLHTLRIYCNGDLFSVRGWFQDEPFLPEKLFGLLKKTLTSVADLLPAERIAGEGEEGWVPLSAVQRCWPQLAVEWDAENWVLSLTY